MAMTVVKPRHAPNPAPIATLLSLHSSCVLAVCDWVELPPAVPDACEVTVTVTVPPATIAVCDGLAALADSD